jgi:hypothetical protein
VKDIDRDGSLFKVLSLTTQAGSDDIGEEVTAAATAVKVFTRKNSF